MLLFVAAALGCAEPDGAAPSSAPGEAPQAPIACRGEATCLAVDPNQAMFDGLVVAVTDGDTLVVRRRDGVEAKIRMQGIDAPEKAQAYGQVAGDALRRLVDNQTVTVGYQKADQYGRILGLIWLDDQTCEATCPPINANLYQATQGYAWWYKQYARDQGAPLATLLEQAEVQAREAKLGLWRDSTPTPPWVWRRQN